MMKLVFSQNDSFRENQKKDLLMRISFARNEVVVVDDDESHH